MADSIGDMQRNSEHAYADDFERVDKVPEQDEAITTTSFTGEEAEEDRYESGTTSEANATSPLLNFDDDLTPQEPHTREPLISFGSQPGLAEPTAPPAPTSEFTSGMGETNRGFDYELEPDTSPFIQPETKVASEPVSVSKPPADTWLKNVDPRVLNLVYWRDVKTTGVVFGSMMFVLLSLSCFSVLSVLAYLSLAVITVTLSFRIYKNVLQAVQKSGDPHPFRVYLDLDIDVPEDKAQMALKNITKHVNNTSRELRRLFLIEDLIDSIKFALLLWVLTYTGAWFNGMTLIILAVVSVFTLPKFYETYKVQIDNYFNMVCCQVDGVMKQVQTKVPFLKRKEKAQ
ncbi:reticulon-1-A-like isoform X2 [Mizuhopecten yessoensis]|uniref:reticulon-1-A-like isoform X2 n=1 Tax=Mizuhopecten yessoensis TaxID=6573 RepID=UPI000B459987|nr:reticulon-1-A-like isoform X2 [Mizuhopecten yessoensis]